jgi:hypothetical protein
MLSVGIAGTTITLGKDWIETMIHPLAAADTRDAPLATFLIFVVIYVVCYNPVWYLEDLRDAFAYQLSASATASEP